MTTTITHLSDLNARSSATTSADSAYELPRRFDVHRVDQTLAALSELAAGRAELSIDASAVEMIDLAGLEALTALAESIRLDIVEPSVAFRATAHYTDHELLVACCDHAELAEVA